jgi:hypothetical protein
MSALLAAITVASLAVGATGVAEEKAHNEGANFSPADFERHVRDLKKKLPDDGFTIVVAPPFVVIGDDSPAEVCRRTKDTVQWAVKKLKGVNWRKFLW